MITDWFLRPVEVMEMVELAPTECALASNLNLFAERSIATPDLLIEERNPSELTIVPTSSYSSEELPANVSGQRKYRHIQVPRTELTDSVMAADVAGIRGNGLMGLNQAYLTVTAEIAERIREMKQKIAATNEYRRIKALQGVIYDADGTTEILNLFTQFGVTQSTFDFDLGNAATDVPEKVRQLVRLMKSNIKGRNPGSIFVFVDSTFLDKIVKHVSMRDTTLRGREKAEAVITQAYGGTDLCSTPAFTEGGVTFVEYSDGDRLLPNPITTPAAVKGAAKGLPTSVTGTGIAFPRGADLYREYFAPRMTLAQVNKKAPQADYAWTGKIYAQGAQGDENVVGIKVGVGRNSLPIVTQPKALIRVISST